MHRWLTVAPWAVVLAMCAYSAAIWPSLPQSIPVHWSMSGPDQYWDKPAGLLLLPALTLLVLVGSKLVPRIDPHRARGPDLAGAFAVATLGVVLLLGAVHIVVLAF